MQTRNNTTLFAGTGTALATPFEEGRVDYTAMGRLIDWQIDQGIDFLVVLGTTGEAPAVSEVERQGVISFAVERAAGRVPVVVGTGGNNTDHSIHNCLEARALGAQGVLIVTPYYNKPTQEGLFRHYETIARKVDLPIVLYNVPGRTGVNLLPETAVRLAAIPNIVALKEASGNLMQAEEVITALHATRPDFAVLSGNDDQAFHMVNSGGHGVISVLSNITPARTARMISQARAGNVEEARAIHHELLPLMRSLFMETNPMPVKYALSRLGFCENRMRLPLVEASPACMRQIDIDLARCNVTANQVEGESAA